MSSFISKVSLMLIHSRNLFSGMTILDQIIVSVLDDWGAFDGNLRQLMYEIKRKNHYTYINPAKVKRRLDILTEKGIVYEKEYKGNVVHYLLSRDYFKSPL